MSADREQFIDAMGDRLATWNLPRATGRVYGYLLLQDEPSRAEELRAELSLSAGAVSTAVRELVAWGLARTIPQPGSRRLLIEATGGFESLLAASHERARAFIRTLQAAESLTETPETAGRLRDVTELFTSYVEAGEHVLRARARRAT
ncbi:GbsR/MarR family transcriptional regulator [Microbacterium sp. JZ37]|uniref:GbsR/MarR family transcriptional regulator n=1 Tax=Microbacterium sp. JZ37 TaxID=2654193 RepID=UPI002B49C64E|nr:MarR family transcriptional regulator [Microbacterium sp. JZ37]WRH18272.1 MarR family transcriptional regulator [Microbacterium sp. JZ37]